MRAGERRPRRAHGFTYVGVLFLVALTGLAIAGTGEAWSLAARRAKEKQLLWTGTQYARAIKSYYLQSPGTRQLPNRLEDLVEDKRFPVSKYHLRQLYVDPVTGGEFGVVLGPDGRIAGVRSKSDDEPMKQDGFPARWRDFKGSTHYSDWLFTADGLPGLPARAASAAAAKKS